MKYTVHLYKAVRMHSVEVEADSQEDAISIAEDIHSQTVTLCGYGFEDDEAPCLGALVDEEGDEDYERSRYHEGPGARAYLGKELK